MIQTTIRTIGMVSRRSQVSDLILTSNKLWLGLAIGVLDTGRLMCLNLGGMREVRKTLTNRKALRVCHTPPMRRRGIGYRRLAMMLRWLVLAL